MKTYFNIWGKKYNSHTNKIKKKNHIIILLDAEKTARKLQCGITVYILGIRQDSKTRDNKCRQGKGKPYT